MIDPEKTIRVLKDLAKKDSDKLDNFVKATVLLNELDAAYLPVTKDTAAKHAAVRKQIEAVKEEFRIRWGLEQEGCCTLNMFERLFKELEETISAPIVHPKPKPTAKRTEIKSYDVKAALSRNRW